MRDAQKLTNTYNARPTQAQLYEQAGRDNAKARADMVARGKGGASYPAKGAEEARMRDKAAAERRKTTGR